MIINLAFDSYTCTSRKTAMNVKEASKKINQIPFMYGGGGGMPTAANPLA